MWGALFTTRISDCPFLYPPSPMSQAHAATRPDLCTGSILWIPNGYVKLRPGSLSLGIVASQHCSRRGSTRWTSNPCLCWRFMIIVCQIRTSEAALYWMQEAALLALH